MQSLRYYNIMQPAFSLNFCRIAFEPQVNMHIYTKPLDNISDHLQTLNHLPVKQNNYTTRAHDYVTYRYINVARYPCALKVARAV